MQQPITYMQKIAELQGSRARALAQATNTSPDTIQKPKATPAVPYSSRFRTRPMGENQNITA